jgi:uncharacterized damage-inducible protein DinB
MHPRMYELIEYLDETRAQLSEAVAAVPLAQRDVRPSADCWSVGEVLEHLTLVEGRIASLYAQKVAAARAAGLGPETETSSVLNSLNRDRMIDRSQRVTAPEPIRPKAEVDAASAWSKLLETREALRTALLSGDGLKLAEITHPHPVLGELNFYQWIVFVASHEARHTAQIREIAAQTGPGPAAVFGSNPGQNLR